MNEDLQKLIEKRKKKIEDRGHALDMAYSEDVDIDAETAAFYELDRLLNLHEKGIGEE